MGNVETAPSPPAAGSARCEMQVHRFAGLLSDMDGTLVDSTRAIIKHWHKIARELQVDPEVILATSHGRRSIDTLRLYDTERATWEYVLTIEGQIPHEFGQDAETVPGARELLLALDKDKGRWAIVTSGTRPLIHGWLAVLNLAHPAHLVSAEDVEHGKPDPACYQLGRARLGLAPDAAVLVLEDAPAGVRSAKAAGCSVVALTTTHDARQLRDAGADWIVRDLQEVTLRGCDVKTGDMIVEIRPCAE
ncbi:MAG: hypothetical protein M1838_002656 [Thelocarpon superellum]|nr:MAG: hypothetical protein M1838_002656 [Thelocarpon superellum]